MTRDLAADVAVFLAGYPGGATVPEIARGVHVRSAEVRAVLQADDRFSGPVPLPERSPKARGWRLTIFEGARTPDGSGRVAA